MQNLHIVYLWNFKPDEKKEVPQKTLKQNRQFIDNYKVVEPDEALGLSKAYGIAELYQKIPDSSWVIKADLARLLYVYFHGQIYLDTDCIIKNDFSKKFETNEVILFKEKYIWYLGLLGKRERKIRLRISNYAFGSRNPKHPFIKQVIDECVSRLHQLLEVEKVKNITAGDILWVCGPDVITTVYHQMKNEMPSIKLLGKKYIKHGSIGSWR